jgi:hypothetical protein
MQAKRIRTYERPTVKTFVLRLGFFLPLMSAVGWLLDREPLHGLLSGAMIAIGSWGLSAFLYGRQQRNRSS